MCPNDFKYWTKNDLEQKKISTRKDILTKEKHTTKSNILNDDAKYRSTPRPYILKSISKTNKPRKINSAISKTKSRSRLSFN